MEKYACFTEITNKFLNGKLEEMSINYGDPKRLTVHISYEYNNFYLFNYDVEVDIEEKSVNFLSHTSNGRLNKVDLNRDKGFEQAVSNYFFS